MIYSDWITLTSKTEKAPLIEAPTNFTYSLIGAFSVNLTWKGVVSAIGYQLERALNSDFSDSVLIYEGIVTNYIDNGLEAETVYHYRLRSFKEENVNINALYLEDFGGMQYSKLFYGTNFDRVTLSNFGDGNTKVMYQGTEDVFDDNDLGMEFIAHKSHQVKGWGTSAKYSKVIQIIDGKNIIVSGEFNRGGTNKKAEIFYDNKDAWSNLLIEYNKKGHNRIYLKPHNDQSLQRGYYYITEVTTHKTVNIPYYIYSESGESTLKLHRDDHLVNGTEGQVEIFNVGGFSDVFVIKNVDILGPINFINTSNVTSRNIFIGALAGSKNKGDAPCIIILNNKADKLLLELKDNGQYEDEMCACFGFGNYFVSGKDRQDEGLLAEPVYGFNYWENWSARAIDFMVYNANGSGAGPYWGTDNCHIYYDNQNDYAITESRFKTRFTSDRTDFNFPDGDIFPMAIETIDSSRNLWPQRDAYSSRSALVQIKGNNDDNFLFVLANPAQFKIYYQQTNGFQPNPLINDETDNKKLLPAHIPSVGDSITLQREYISDLGYYDMAGNVIPNINKLDYNCDGYPALRSHISWTTYFQKHGTLFTQEEFDKMNGIVPIYLQVGDVLKNKKTNINHTVKQIYLGYYTVGFDTNMSGYPFEYKPFIDRNDAKSHGFSQVNNQVTPYTCYILDPPLENPTQSNESNFLLDFEVIVSRAQYLKEGDTFDGKMSWQSNQYWTQDSINKEINAVDNVSAHGMYCQRELNHDHRNGKFIFYYRENNMNYNNVGGVDYYIIDPDTGENIKTRSLYAYCWFGSQHVNMDIPDGQYGGGYDHMFPQRDKLLRSQGITEPDSEMAKQRNFGTVNQGKKVTDPKYYVNDVDVTKARPRPARLLEVLDFVKNNN